MMVTLWLGRIGLLGMLNYGAYDLVATSPLLHSANGDVHLWKPGAELLWAVVSSRWTALETLSAALVIVAAVALAASLALSSIAWRATAAPQSLGGMRLCLSAARRIPAFALLSTYTILLTIAVAWVWLDLVPLLGRLCLPLLGERYTDLVQLAVFALLLASTAGIFVTADVARAMLAQRSISVGASILVALRVMRSHAILVYSQASIRLLAVVLLQLMHLWLLARTGWFARASLHYVTAILTTELVALVAIWLRLGFMAWLVDFVRRTSK
jgi:hypothetical protein